MVPKQARRQAASRPAGAILGGRTPPRICPSRPESSNELLPVVRCAHDYRANRQRAPPASRRQGATHRPVRVRGSSSAAVDPLDGTQPSLTPGPPVRVPMLALQRRDHELIPRNVSFGCREGPTRTSTATVGSPAGCLFIRDADRSLTDGDPAVACRRFAVTVTSWLYVGGYPEGRQAGWHGGRRRHLRWRWRRCAAGRWWQRYARGKAGE